jgi:cysteinyl-tRNA synthetase
MGQMVPMLDDIERRTGERPVEHLVDGGFAKREAITEAAERGVTVYAPVSHAETGDEAIATPENGWTLDTAVDEVGGTLRPLVVRFDKAVSDDLNTAVALTVLEDLLSLKKMPPREVLSAVAMMDTVLGLGLLSLARADFRVRPKDATIAEAEIEDALARRKAARAEKDFATSDAIRDELAARRVEVMDGDPLGWEWKLGD